MDFVKVAIYVRVSTTKQECENQLIQLRKFAEKSEWDIYKEYCDIISGKEESRPEYDEIFKDAHKKLFDGVLFWSLDRFARSGTLFTLQKLKELDNLNIFWHSYQEPYVSSVGPWKDVVISIFATIAKLERERISERTKAGFYKDKDGVLRGRKTKKKVGRPNVPQSAINQIDRIIKKYPNTPVRKIREQMTYKIKHGAIRHPSIGFICERKKIIVQKTGMKSNTL